MTLPPRPIRERWLRLVGGALLLLPASLSRIRNLPFLRDALLWEPLLYGLWLMGLLAVLVAIGQLLAGLRQGAPPPACGRRIPQPIGLDLLLLLSLATGGVLLMSAWSRISNPEMVLSGYDYNTYALNAAAVTSGEWSLYNPDKHIFHARMVDWLVGRGNQREAMVRLSVVSIGLLPALSYLLARRAGGQSAALLSALLVLASPLIWPFTTQTTAYPLFYALITAASAALLWLLQRPSFGSAVVTGLLAGAAAATQEKTVINLAPLLGLVFLLGLPGFLRALWGHPLRTLFQTLLCSTVALGLLLAILKGTAPPKAYTPFVNLLTNQREEVHRFMPYDWPVVGTPDINDPAGLRRWLPRALWNGEIESWVAAIRTPPDSNSLRMSREQDGRSPPWVVAPHTTLPPVAIRLKGNLLEVKQIYGPLPKAGLFILGLGALSLLLFGRGRQRFAVGLSGVLLSGLAPLTLRYGEHYYPQLVPIAATLGVVGLDALLLRLFPGRWVWLGRAPLWWIGLSYALAWWNHDAGAWRHPSTPFPPPSAVAHTDPGHYALNLQRVGEWLEASGHTQAIIDCVPGTLLLVMPFDPRLSHALGEGACTQGLQSASPGQWAVVSGHREYRSPSTPDPQVLLESGAWKRVWGSDGRKSAAEPPEHRWSDSAVLILEAVAPGGEAPQ